MGFGRRPSVLLVGEAAGPWGARFSGVPFTSERQLEKGGLPFRGRKSSNHEPPYSENSGTVVWGALLPRYPEFFLWNAVPLHPHRKGEPLSIRTPGAREIRAFCPLLREALDILRNPSGAGQGRVVAVGRKAEYALKLIGVPCLYARHPAQSGAARFRAGISRAFTGV
ncbi:MAG: uracil-DNA glycosylase [Nitrospiraceae bacterium]|nr:uracil-DNA glycosylase [Nitrospiraceae bacterium]